MKITKTYLRQVIKEELSAVMAEDVVSLDAYRKEKAEQEEKEKEEKEATQAASLQKRIEDHQNLLNQFLVKGGAALLNRLAEDPDGEEDIRGHEVLQKLADFDPSQQLNLTLYNIIEAWKERRKLLKSVLKHALGLHPGEEPKSHDKARAARKVEVAFNTDGYLSRPTTDQEKEQLPRGPLGWAMSSLRLKPHEFEAVKNVWFSAAREINAKTYEELYDAIMDL
jgi:hypothetical protein